MLRNVFRRLRHPLRRDDGQAAFEFLLVLPFFFMVFLLLIDFGISMYGYVSISNAVREGARYGSVNCGALACTEALVQQRVVDRSGGFVSDTSEVTVSWPSGGVRGDPIAVRVDHDHDFLFFPYTWTISSCSAMRLEQTEPGITAGGSGC